jgi:hypothetical protein
VVVFDRRFRSVTLDDNIASMPEREVSPKLWGSNPAPERMDVAVTPVVPSAFSGQIQQFLLKRGQEFVGETTTPQQVDVRSVATAIFAVLHYSGHTHRVVVKSTASNGGIRSASELARVLTALRASDEQIASRLPPILGFDEPSQLIVLGYVDGQRGSSLLESALKTRDGAPQGCELLRESAASLACFQTLAARDFLPDSKVRTNGSFVPGFRVGAATLSSVFGSAGFDSLDRLLERVTPEFLAREGDRMFLIDARPKNLIAKASGGLCFIDLDWSAGNPGIGISSFLVALDRIGCRHPWPASQARIALWKRAFVEAYASSADGPIGDDLTFFYPWTVLQMLAQHCALRPAFTPYLRWYYGTQLGSFLRVLRSLSPAEVAQAPAALFSTDSD